MSKSKLLQRANTGIVAALMVGVFLSPINVNFTSIAMPSLQNYFSIDIAQLAWVGTAYFIPTVVFMPIFAALGERLGLRRTYVFGIFLLSTGSFLAAMASSFQWLLFSRIIQGIGWSGLYPLSLILIRKQFPSGQQGEVMGLWESAVGFAAIIGPVVGGILIRLFAWPSVYLTLGILAAIGGLVSLLSIPSEQNNTRPLPVNWRGMISFSFAVSTLLFGITLRSFVILAVSSVAFIVWFFIEKNSDNPFVSPGIFRNRAFITAAGAANLRMIIGIASVMSLPLFFEGVQNLTPSTVGLILPIYSLFLFLGARPGGRWADRAESRFPATAGFALMTLGLLLLAFVSAETTILFFALALVIRGIGAGVSQSPFARVATNSMSDEQGAIGAGLYGMVRYSGLVFGSALVGMFLEWRFSAYGSSGRDLAAVPAFRELFAVLTLLALVGVLLSWAMKEDHSLATQAIKVAV